MDCVQIASSFNLYQRLKILLICNSWRWNDSGPSNDAYLANCHSHSSEGESSFSQTLDLNHSLWFAQTQDIFFRKDSLKRLWILFCPKVKMKIINTLSTEHNAEAMEVRQNPDETNITLISDCSKNSPQPCCCRFGPIWSSCPWIEHQLASWKQSQVCPRINNEEENYLE